MRNRQKHKGLLFDSPFIVDRFASCHDWRGE